MALDLKYPRTYHLPSSPGLQNDDRRLPDINIFKGRQVVLTEKADGEGSTLTRAKTYPRSPDGRPHPSRDWIKAYHARKAHDIPERWRISGEGMYAVHSIAYRNSTANALRSYFYGFGVWDETNTLLAWDETLEIFQLLDIAPVTVLYRGHYYDGLVEEIAARMDPRRQEGFVLRVDAPIAYPSGAGDKGRFFDQVAKWVRPAHVATDEHWMTNWRDEPAFVNELLPGVPLYA